MANFSGKEGDVDEQGFSPAGAGCAGRDAESMGCRVPWTTIGEVVSGAVRAALLNREEAILLAVQLRMVPATQAGPACGVPSLRGTPETDFYDPPAWIAQPPDRAAAACAAAASGIPEPTVRELEQWHISRPGAGPGVWEFRVYAIRFPRNLYAVDIDAWISPVIREEPTRDAIGARFDRIHAVMEPVITRLLGGT